ncbi:hypothetical protein OHA21_25845 [Actinoplanes sp. NBC_00393]|uniref:hypothetical protein n=1 Tax=Actinoplanes sp. NBC_00393 TaxID=2975953 RepID=UPI002E2071E7
MQPLANMIWQIADVQAESTREMENAMGRLAAATSRALRRVRRGGGESPQPER